MFWMVIMKLKLKETTASLNYWVSLSNLYFNVGAGVQFKLSKKVNLAIEDKLTISKTDLLDGQQWQENGLGAATAQTRDYDIYNFLSVGLNIAILAVNLLSLYGG